MAQQLRLVERREWGGQPETAWIFCPEQLLLQGLQGGPPQPSHAVLITGAVSLSPAQKLAQVAEAGSGHQCPADADRLCLTTERLRPRAMKFTTIAERP